MQPSDGLDVASSALTHFSADSLTTYELDGTVLISSDSLGSPHLIAVGRDRIYVGDTKASRSLLIFDRHTGDFVSSVGDEGQGPREINFLWAMDFKPGQDSGWLFEFSPRRMLFFDGGSLTGESIVLQDLGAPMGPAWITGSRIASVGMYEEGRLAVHRADGDFMYFIGDHPPGESDVPVPVRQHAFEALIQTNSDSSKIVVATQNTDRIEIYDTDSLLHTIRGPVFSEPHYTVHHNDSGDSWLSLDDETIKSYSSVAATDEFIFALYSGRTLEWLKRTTWFVPPGRTVFVFTWSGHPVATLNIEDGVVAIGVSADSHNLYAVYHRPAPMVLHYEIPELD